MRTLFDVDVPKRSEQRIRAAQDYCDTLMAIVNRPIVVIDRGLRIRAVNERFARSPGRTPGVLVGKRMPHLDGAGSLRALQDAIHGWVATMSGLQRIPLELDTDGERATRWLSGSCVPWHESPDSQVPLLAISAPAPTAGGE